MAKGLTEECCGEEDRSHYQGRKTGLRQDWRRWRKCYLIDKGDKDIVNNKLRNVRMLLKEV
jgi:hypothetical protein